MENYRLVAECFDTINYTEQCVKGLFKYHTFSGGDVGGAVGWEYLKCSLLITRGERGGCREDLNMIVILEQPLQENFIAPLL